MLALILLLTVFREVHARTMACPKPSGWAPEPEPPA